MCSVMLLRDNGHYDVPEYATPAAVIVATDGLTIRKINQHRKNTIPKVALVQ